VANKNLYVRTAKKGSKMTKKRGSKKGQKWPKMGVQKRVKKGPEIEFLELTKKNVTNTRVDEHWRIKKSNFNCEKS
jgi:hypothetical protein